MQFDEQRDLVTVERILRAVFIDPERPSPVSQTSLRTISNLNTGLMCNNANLVSLGFGKTEKTAGRS